MKESIATIAGKIINQETQKGLPQLGIEVWIKTKQVEQKLGVSVTDTKGKFSIQIDTADDTIKEAALLFKIYRGVNLVQSTAFNKLPDGTLLDKIIIPVQLPVTDNKWLVMGRVTTPNGQPVKAEVVAVNIKLNGRQPLGKVQTDSGRYVISYQPEVIDESTADCKLPDIQVEAYLNNKVIASSEVVYNAEKVINIDLVVGNEIYKGPSEYELLEEKLKPCLGDKDPATLNTDDVEYLTHKTGANQNWITAYAIAHRQGKSTEAAPALFYGCFRKQLPYGLDKLIALKTQVIRFRVQMAIDENIIDEKWGKEVDDFMASLKNSSIKSALIIDEKSTKTSLGKLFTQIKIPTNSQVALLDLYVKHKEDTPAFWKALSKHKTLGQYEKQLKLGLKISALTQHYEPATKVLMEHPVFAQGADISKLAHLSTDDWVQIAKGIGSAPENIPGEGEEQLMNYGLLMGKSIMTAFPSQHVAANVVKSDRYQNTELPKFFEIAPDFSFEGTNIPAYVNKLNGSITDKEAVIKDLSKLQRLFYLAPALDRYKVMDSLDKEGVGSALQVRKFGKKAFINVFGAKFGKTLASRVYSKASYVSATTMNLALQYNDLNGGVLPYVLRGSNGQSTKPDELDLPDLSTLFGTQSFCSCKHCRSVYSPAAYFVDLLSYLGEHYVIDEDASTEEDIVYTETTGLDLLFKRRSELGNILLNCENTNTVIPYLDIVNEVLENAIDPLLPGVTYQTTSTTDELKANPEHITVQVYDDYLAKEIFPFSQPFNLWNEEGEIYLEHLNIPRHVMMDVFQFRGNNNEPDNLSKYAVQFNLSNIGKDIIIGNSGKKPFELWGIEEANWVEVLSKVRTFIDKAEISYEQLLEFLQLSFSNPMETIRVKFASDAPCDIDQAELAYWDESSRGFTGQPIHAEFFIRAHGFFRLLRKTPWTIFEMGRVMDSLGIQRMNEEFFECTAILLQLQLKFEIEPLELVSWWAPLNTQSDQNNADDRSFFAQYFLSKAVFDPQAINEEAFVFTLNEDGSELKDTTNMISDYLNEIAAALNISSSDMERLAETLLTSLGEVDDALNIENLSQLFRKASFTKALDISVEEYLIAVDFIADNPFDRSRPTELLSFIDQVEQVQGSGFSFAELQYLLLDEYNSNEGIAPTEDRAIQLLTSLQEGLVKIKTDLEVPRDESIPPIPVDPTGEICKQKLSLLWEQDGIDAIVSIVETINVDVDGVPAEMTPDHQTDAATYLFFLDVNLLISEFSTESFNNVEARYAYILLRLVDYLVVTQSRSLIIQTISTDLTIDLDTAELLLTELVYSTGVVHDPGNPVFAIDDYTDPKFAYHESEDDEIFDLSEFSVQHNNYLTLYKSAFFINKFSLNAEEVSWTFTNSPAIGWLDLNAISGAARDVFQAWRKMAYFFHMRRQYAEGDTTFFNLMDYAAEPLLMETLETGYDGEVEDFIAQSSVWTDADKNFLVFLSLLSEITGWESDSLFYLASSDAYALSFEDFKDELAYNQLMKCFEVLNTLGASAQDVWTWMAVDLTSVHSGNIKQTAKAKYSQNRWLDVAAPLRDVLREKQRDALTAYLIQNKGFKDENALYEYYLLDVETSACTLSSRIELANSSVQLFVQRHLMNLEAETLDLDVDRWELMKNYRVWEANRKVFLYPENWIEPELRLVKSEFFTGLQDALLQNDVTADLVETTVRDYLEKLDEVSNIEVCGMYHQVEEDGDGSTSVDLLHVFGKTNSTPNEYYYRTYIDSSYWTSWEKVNISIQGKHLIPVVINRMLHLFWAEFTEKQEEISENKVMTYWEIRLAYSEFKNGKWLPKKSFEEHIESDKLNTALALEAGNLNLDNYGLHNICFLTTQYKDFIKFTCFQVLDLSGNKIQYKEGTFQFYYGSKKIVSDNAIQIILTGINNLIKPSGTDIDYMSFKEFGGADLELANSAVDVNGNYLGNEEFIKILDSTPGTFSIPLLHQYDEFVSQDNFFYGDNERNFFVKPYTSFFTNGELLNLPDYSHGSTLDLDFYMSESDIAVGIFQETTYNTKDIEGIIFGSEPKDQIDPIPDLKEKDVGVMTRESVLTTNLIAEAAQLPQKAGPNIDLNFQSPPLEQFHYLGTKAYKFANFYHPYVNDFIKRLNLNGVDGLLTRNVQQQNQEYFETTYLPTENVPKDYYPKKEVDFSLEGAMSIYNWELFFHIPMLLADSLSKNQRFEEAQQWYHYIFNPLDRTMEASPNKFWQFKEFFELYDAGESGAEDSIYSLLNALSYEGTDSRLLEKKAEVEQQIATWLKSPFDPHAIASLRPIAYMKSTVMKYIDNLINWGDHLFRQDNRESINEATQVYILAAQILGERPELISAEETDARTYNELIHESGGLDPFSNALVSLENFYNSEGLATDPLAQADLLPASLYFCIPNNPNLLAYWDTVEDRLFKIRHCMNIEGLVRQLPLFQEPIDPGLLVKARAAGLSIGSVLNDLYAPLPHFRYQLMLQKALEFCSDVKAMGNALLSVLEKRDAEEMAQLRAGHELKLLQMVSDTKKLQLDEAREYLSSLSTMRKITEARHDYYVKIEKLSAKEKLHLNKLEAAQILQSIGQGYDLAAQHSRLIPEAEASVPPAATFGGANLGDALNFYGSYHRFLSSIESYQATKASIEAGHDRRWDDWKLQEKLAEKELSHIDKQITAAEIRVAIMEKEMDNHAAQIENSREVSDFMTNKFTNKELYNWMSDKLSAVYFQSYQMAYDLAKKAQRCFQYELASDQTFIQFGYWDSLRKGLLSGDKLYQDLRRMEMAYLDQNKRTFELTKSVSLAMLDPLALIQLRETGTCYINLPEALYDLDHPGHYLRRIKSVQLTIPCVSGPYTSINCKLTLLDNKWRKDTTGATYGEDTDNNEGFDPRFVYNTGGIQSIATSSGQNDSGMFQLNFNDERYLPFEGAGTVSNWRLEIPSRIRSFDFNTISDVIMQLSYTAKDGGDLLKQAVNETLESALQNMILGSENQGLTRMFSLKHEFSNDWYRFLNPPEEQDEQSALLNIEKEKFPFIFRQNDIVITSLEMVVVLEDGFTKDTNELKCLVAMPSGDQLKSYVNGTETEGITLSSNDSVLGGQLYQLSSVPFTEEPGDWVLTVKEEEINLLSEDLKIEKNGHTRLNSQAVKDLIIIFHYAIS